MKPQTYAQQRAESLTACEVQAMYDARRVLAMSGAEFEKHLVSRVSQRYPASAPSVQHSMVTK